MISFKRQGGVTLFEVLLVLVLASLVLMMGFQTFYQLQVEQELNRVKFNVDSLFLGARNYYLANCRANINYATGAVINTATGQLDPIVNPPPASGMKAIDITTDLLTPGYLAKWPPAVTPVFITDYEVQFNVYNDATKYPANIRNVNFCVYNAGPPVAFNCSPLATQLTSNVYLWTIQVAVQITDTSKTMQYYQGRLNADCISTLNGGFVTPCSQVTAGGGGNYLVFERLPSSALSTSNTSPLWASVPELQSFVQQYTNDDDYAVTNNDTIYNTSTGYQNYLCGG